MNVGITAVGHYTPSLVLTNEELVARFGLDVDAEWIESRTGIVSRHWLQPDETTSDLVVGAARRILDRAGRQPVDVDLLIVATISPDYPSPATATIAARKLGCRCPCFDLSAACAGFLYALEIGANAVRGGAHNVLVVAADARSRFLDPNDRRALVLFADGGAGVLLGPTTEPGLLATHTGAEGRQRMGAHIPAGGAMRPASAATVAAGQHYLQVDGRREIFDLFIEYTRETTDAVLERAGLTLADIDLFITHQGNARMVEAVVAALDIDPERAVNSIAHHGNVSGATVPLALSEAVQSGRIEAGDKVLITSVGAGYTFGSAIYEFP